MRPADIAEIGRRFEVGGHTRDHVILTNIAPEIAEGQIRT